LGIFKNVGLDAAIINKSVTVQGDEKWEQGSTGLSVVITLREVLLCILVRCDTAFESSRLSQHADTSRLTGWETRNTAVSYTL
jgi:hypothetical protein